MYAISPDLHEPDMPLHLVQKFQVIEGGNQTEKAPLRAKWIVCDGKLVCQWNVKQ